MKVPSVIQADIFLVEAEKLNPGPWVLHSKTTAQTAKCIAQSCRNLQPDIAYALGLLHDIGRREGVKQLAHILDGYTYLMGLSFDDAARICLTHSFPLQEVETFFGTVDCSNEDYSFLKNYIDTASYTDYDKLIQLCDAICLPQGAVLMEKRLVDVVMRHGMPEFTLRKWKAYLELKDYFDELTSCNIYSLIPNLVQNTFEL